MKKNKYSLWLCPDRETRNRLRKTINDLSRQLNSSHFEPHITLCSPMSSFDQKDQIILEKNGSHFSVFNIRPEKFSYQSVFFRCLYIAVQKSDALLRINRLFTEQFLIHKKESFEPHISLVYKDPNAFDPADIIDTLDQSLLAPMKFNRLSVVETSGEISEWKTIMEIKLHE